MRRDVPSMAAKFLSGREASLTTKVADGQSLGDEASASAAKVRASGRKREAKRAKTSKMASVDAELGRKPTNLDDQYSFYTNKVVFDQVRSPSKSNGV